jgi:ankyrin repeat protein
VALALIKGGALDDLPPQDTENAIRVAVSAGPRDVLLLLLRTLASKSETFSKDYSSVLHEVLCLACDRGHDDVVKYLLHIGCDPNTINASGPSKMSTLLYAAVGRGHTRIIDTLLKNNANPNSPFCDVTPLHLACSRGNMEVIRRLVDAKTGAFPISLNPPPTSDVSVL